MFLLSMSNGGGIMSNFGLGVDLWWIWCFENIFWHTFYTIPIYKLAPRPAEPFELLENLKIYLKSTQIFKKNLQKSTDRSKVPPSVGLRVCMDAFSEPLSRGSQCGACGSPHTLLQNPWNPSVLRAVSPDGNGQEL